jgi:peroxiredoxin
MKKMKNQLKIRGCIFLAALVVSVGMTPSYGQTVGEVGPDFQVNLLGGGTFKLSDNKGKVVFVFLFGNTCPSCKAVGPTVESSIYQKFKGDPDFVAIGLDTWDSSSGDNSVTGFKNSTGISFPLAIKAGSVASAYGTTYDRFMVIDKDGVLAHKSTVGAANDVNNTISVIEQSLIVAGLSGLSAAEAGVRVYPVPADSEVHFESNEPISQIRIYDAAGKLVLDESGFSGAGVLDRTLPVSTLKKGLYFYSLQRADGFVSGKLIIQR